MTYEADENCRVREHAGSVQTGSVPGMQTFCRGDLPYPCIERGKTDDDHTDLLHQKN